MTALIILVCGVLYLVCSNNGPRAKWSLRGGNMFYIDFCSTLLKHYMHVYESLIAIADPSE